MACQQNLTDLIVAQANSQGVDPAIALRVASQESGICQWKPDGSVLRGSSGEYGVFQLMPATAAQLGVDPTDVNGNITGGIRYLKQLYTQFGNWPQAIAAYNAGPGAVAAGNIPSSTQKYVSSVLAGASVYARQLAKASGAVAGDVIQEIPGQSNLAKIIFIGGAALVAMMVLSE